MAPHPRHTHTNCSTVITRRLLSHYLSHTPSASRPNMSPARSQQHTRPDYDLMCALVSSDDDDLRIGRRYGRCRVGKDLRSPAVSTPYPWRHAHAMPPCQLCTNADDYLKVAWAHALSICRVSTALPTYQRRCVHRVVQDLATAMAPCFVVIFSGLLAVAGHYLWKHKLQRMEQRMEHAVTKIAAASTEGLNEASTKVTTAGADVRRAIQQTATSVALAGADERRSRKPGTLKTSSWRPAASVRLPLPRAAPGSTGSPGTGRCDSGSSDKLNPEMPLIVSAHLVSKASALKRARPAKRREGQGDDHVDTLPDDADNGVDFDRQLLQQLTKLNYRLDQLVPTQPTHGHSVQNGAPFPEEEYERLSTDVAPAALRRADD